MDKLLPCPFCGGEGETQTGMPAVYVACLECGSVARACDYRNFAENAWNTRYAPSEVNHDQA